MCNCIEEIEKLITEQFESEINVEDKVYVQIEGKSINIKLGITQLSTTAEATYLFKGKNKKWRTYLNFSFCPLCGEKYIKE